LKKLIIEGSSGNMTKSKSEPNATRRTSLKTLAEHLHLSPSTISYVLNDSPGRSIPDATRERIRAATKEFKYQPSMIARTLQGKRMQTIGVLLPELGEGYHSQVLSGVGDLLMREVFFYFTVHHRHRKDLVSAYPELLRSRGVDGILAIDTHLEEDCQLPLPTVLVAGHTHLSGVTNVVLNHHRAAELAVGHLYDLGHRKIAFMQGQPFSSDSDTRWGATMEVARALGLEVSDELTVHLEKDSHSPGNRLSKHSPFDTNALALDGQSDKRGRPKVQCSRHRQLSAPISARRQNQCATGIVAYFGTWVTVSTPSCLRW
jgi:DNA-binding LacI/PurR family transcriptional regulator